MSGQISKSNPREDLRRVFSLFDSSGKGEISAGDLKRVS